MQTGLTSAEVSTLSVPGCTAQYLCAVIMEGLRESTSLEKYSQRDMPEGTIATAPDCTDLNRPVTLKKGKLHLLCTG